MDLVDLIVEKRDAIKQTCAKYGATNVRVFGSCARDDYSENSDVDLIVQFSGQLDLAKFFRLKEELEKLIGKEVDLTTDEMLRPEIRADVLSDAVAI